MFPQRRMTTDTPDGNYEQSLNLFVRGEDGWVQMPSRSISLNDYMKQLIKAHNADIDTEGTPEEFDMTLTEHLFDGPETIEGLLAEHYTLSWALASLRDRLKNYEDAGIPEIMPEGLRTIDRAIGTYGKDAQLTKAVEEMSELTKALCKLKECKRKYDTPFNRETQEVYSNIEEEIADVFIMLVQLFAIFNSHELVNITKIVWDKLDRLKDNLDKEASKQEDDNAGKSEFDKALGELHDLTEWEDAEAAIRELHARGPEIERLYLDSKILPGELRALVMVSNCLEREFIHRQLATGQPLHMNAL